MKFIGFYSYTVILTYLSLVSGILGMRYASIGKFDIAIICLAISGFCDMFDGLVARTKKNRTTDEKNFGIQIDSLCDLICFGVFPAVFLYYWGINTTLGIIILIFYILCALIRLAFFNVLETKRQTKEGGCTKGYRGLPVTSSATIFPIFYIVGLFLSKSMMTYIYYALPILVGFLFILDFHFPKIDLLKIFQKKK